MTDAFVWLVQYNTYTHGDDDPITNTLIFSSNEKAEEWVAAVMDNKRYATITSYCIDSGYIHD